MGYNTVAFLLNDYMHYLRESPITVTWGLSHPPMGEDEYNKSRWHAEMNCVADQNKEPRVHPQALEVLGTFHASDTTYLRAGGNCIERLNIVRYGKTKEGKNTVTLELPDWWNKKEHR